VPHSAWLAQAESDYVPMLRPLALTHPVLIVAKGSAFKRLTDLRGRTIAVPDPMALISAQALDLLRQNGLEPGRDVSLRHFPTHSAAVNRVLDGEVAAAIVSERALQQMTNGPQERVRVLYSWKQGAVPGIVYLAHPAMPAERVERLTAALLAFANESPEGRVFMEQTGYRGLVRLSPDELAPFAPYGQWLKAEIGRAEERQAPGAAK
jgi:ABC-type phosphate/phosphonate transport system substrate-binding protein